VLPLLLENARNGIGLNETEKRRDKNAMNVISYTDARNNLKSVLDRVIDDADVAVITRKEGQHAVVMGQDYYNSVMETLHLMSSPSNAVHLAKSIAELRASKAIKRELLDDEET
jgi:antitoxin YefM